MNKMLGYFELSPSTLASETETTKMDRRKLNIALEVLNKVSVKFPETKQFIEEHLQQKCLKENISVEEATYFLTSLVAKN